MMVFDGGGCGGFQYVVDLQWGWWFALGFLDLSFVVLGFDRGKIGLLVDYDGGCGRSEFRERGGRVKRE